MMYPFMTLDDNTEIVHSAMKEDGQVKVYLERPDEKVGFHLAACWLSGYTWEDVFGFSAQDMERFQKALKEKFA